ncbi:MAG: hypothetical protein Q8L37_02160 [Candidatus Gottesmanbacteria bacterium]|nr:hypothetical protein [Candidatus Gottesmanbacteria bacterium]
MNKLTSFEELQNPVSPPKTLNDDNQNLPVDTKNKMNWLWWTVGGFVVLILGGIGVGKILYTPPPISNPSSDVYVSPTPNLERSSLGSSIASVDNTIDFFFPRNSLRQGASNEKFTVSSTPGSETLDPWRVINHAELIARDELFIKPFRVTTHYKDDAIKHLREDSLSVYIAETNKRGYLTYTKKLKTTLNIKENIATAEAMISGDFGLLGELLCPADTDEDKYDFDGKIADRIFFNKPRHIVFDIKAPNLNPRP